VEVLAEPTSRAKSRRKAAAGDENDPKGFHEPILGFFAFAPICNIYVRCLDVLGQLELSRKFLLITEELGEI